MGKASIAIIGTSGFLGQPVIDAIESGIFDDKIAFPVKAVTRTKKTSTDKVQYVQGALDELGVDVLAAQLKGINTIISLVGGKPDLYVSVEKLVKLVKPQLYIPSQFGTEIDKSAKIFPGLLGFKQEHSENLRSAGIKVVDIVTGLFAVPGAFLYELVGAVGVDAENKTVTYRGNADEKFPVSKVDDIGRVVVAVALSNPDSLPDKVRTYSDVVSQRQVVERYEQTHNVKFAVKEVSASESLKEGQDKWNSAGFKLELFFFYLNVLLSQGTDNGLIFSKDERDLVNSHELLWKWSKF